MYKIWIDLSNSPHILFFQPIIKKFEQEGIEYLITIRDFAQTEELTDLYKYTYTKIGKHSKGKNIFKLFNILGRAYRLRSWARDKNFTLALNHSSYSQIIAAKSLKIPIITLMDYEYQPANHISFRLSDYLFVPNSFSGSIFRKYGANADKVYKYNGIKEELYLSNFKPEEDFLNTLYKNIDVDIPFSEFKNKVIITIRPPATMAAYHQFENLLFYDLLSYIDKFENIIIVYLPRNINQKKEIEGKKFLNIYCLNKVLDGKNLIYHSDIIISAGGTMNREAAILGTPAYTVFAGKIGSVDKELIKKGLLREIKDKSDFSNILIEKNKNRKKIFSYKLLDEIYMRIINILKNKNL
jgi:uncharacterized protein